MIDFHMPEELLEKQRPYERIALEIMRPLSRYYDEHEHEQPHEFIRAVWPLIREETRRAQQIRGREAAAEPGEPDTSLLSTILLAELLSWADAGQFLARPGPRLGGVAVEAVGTPEQKARFLKRFAEGERPAWGAMAMTEPDAGSDTSAVRTTAVLDEEANEWVLNGEKIFITSGSLALQESEGLCVVWATVDRSAGRKGIKPFVVEANAPGLQVSPGLDKLGIRASDTVILTFEDVRIPYDNILGSPEVQSGASTKGFKGAMKTFDASRPAVAASACGIARAALEYTWESLTDAGYQMDLTKPKHLLTSVEGDLLEMEAQHKAAWLLTLRAAVALLRDRDGRLEASMCKVQAGKAVTFITQKAVELLGPPGYSCQLLAEKWMRDAKINELFEGTSQINLLIIARSILGYSRRELK